MRIEEVAAATPEIHEALARLLPQLNPTLPLPTPARLQQIIDDPDVTLLLARDEGLIVGTATLIVYATPFWMKARLDEVVVDASARGRGVGEAVISACLDLARRKGAQVAELQSGRGPARDVANRLYRRMGFELRDSNLYRFRL
jgi:GNAT superfamily N-acetyltransferase